MLVDPWDKMCGIINISSFDMKPRGTNVKIQ